MDILTIITTLVGGIGGASGILTLFSLRQKRDSFTIQNMTAVIEQMKAQHKEFQDDANNKISTLERRMNQMDLKNRLQNRAINHGYRCSFLLSQDADAQCPIIIELEKEMRIVDGIKPNDIPCANAK